MAAIPLPSPFKISPPPAPPSTAALRRPFLRPPPTKLAPPRPSSVPAAVEIVSTTECSDGSVVFRFADGEALKREAREFEGNMEGKAESCDLVVEREVGAEDSDVVSHDKLDAIEVFDELTERGRELEVESEVDSLEERDRETMTESVRLGGEYETELKEVELEEHVVSVETVSNIISESPEDEKLSSSDSRGLDSFKDGQETEGMELQSDEVLEEEKSSDLDVEKGESGDGILLIEEISAFGEEEDVQGETSLVRGEPADVALVSTERFEDDSEASGFSVTMVDDLGMDAESSSVALEEDAGDNNITVASVTVILLSFP